jgi:peptide/nickel transport system substrate-binding protein
MRKQMPVRSIYKRAIACLAFAIGLAVPVLAHSETTLRVVMQSDLKILDPIWTTAYIVRNYGYMVYDTLFAMDANGDIKPQMVDSYSVSADNLTWTFTLRDGLLFHDGAPVTSDDCIASIKRWGAKDAVGQALMTFIKDMKATDAKTFTISLNASTGLMLQGLGKPSSNPAFIMPKRVAETPPSEQIRDYVGSGPFVFRSDEWKPGVKAIFVKFDKYKPRPEPVSGMAGGKVVKLDRVEWIVMSDQQTAVNALKAGEIDFMEQPQIDLLPEIAKSPDIKLVDGNPLGFQFAFRFNTLHKPFDNPKIRQALLYAFNQEDFMKATVGDSSYYKACKALFICGTPFASDEGMTDKLESNFKKARQLLKEAEYDGAPVVLLQSTDLAVLTNLAPVAKSLMEKIGMKVDMQSMDWQTVVARRTKKDAPDKGGWNAMLTSWVAADVLNPVGSAFVNASCDKAPFGWPCDPELEKLRSAFAHESDPVKQKAIAEAVQVRETEYPTYINVGQYYLPFAMRKNITGVISAPVTVFWNVEKTGG